jgi:aldose 1-epimerase
MTLVTLRNRDGLTATIMQRGATLTSLVLPDGHNAVLGFPEDLDGYVRGCPYFGATVGRFGNRICDGRFTLDGREYALAKNNSPGGIGCALHGGVVGFDKRDWAMDPVVGAAGEDQSLTLRLVSQDGDEGYPGTLTVAVTYTLPWASNEVRISYVATVEGSATPVNLTNHSYFNLGGRDEPITGHVAQLHASHYLPVNAGLIPTGEIAAVEGTPFDFRTPKRISAGIDADHEQIRLGKGYDHCWVLDGPAGTLRRVATVTADNGRKVECWTTEPGVQFYTGNFLDGSCGFKHRTGFCLETQHFPDSPNKPNFPSTILRPGETYKTETRYRF